MSKKIARRSLIRANGYYLRLPFPIARLRRKYSGALEFAECFTSDFLSSLTSMSTDFRFRIKRKLDRYINMFFLKIKRYFAFSKKAMKAIKSWSLEVIKNWIWTWEWWKSIFESNHSKIEMHSNPTLYSTFLCKGGKNFANNFLQTNIKALCSRLVFIYL